MKDIADALFDAVSRYDHDAFEALVAPGAVRWLNFSGEEMPIHALRAIAERERAVTARSDFVRRGLMLCEEGFVLQMHIDGETKGGTAFAFPVCLVVHVEDGKITRVEEYADSAQVQPLVAEMFAKSGTGDS
jgi:ketosteroid isomerase-like protein